MKLRFVQASLAQFCKSPKSNRLWNQYIPSAVRFAPGGILPREQVRPRVIGGTALVRSVVALAIIAVAVTPAFGQVIVDCTGATPGAFTSINAALSVAGPGSAVLVTGPCTENVYVSGKSNLFLGSWWGQYTDLNGSLNISTSEGVYLYGLTY
jgi:hypothetical protein